MSLSRIAPSLRKILAVSLTSSAFLLPLTAFAEKKTYAKNIQPISADLAVARAAIHRLTAVPGSGAAKTSGTAPASRSAESSSSGTASSGPASASAPRSSVSLPEGISETASDAQAASTHEALISQESSQQAANEAHLLKGSVTHATQKSPLMYDKVQELPKGTTVNLVSLVNINSEVNRKGDEIWVRVGNDVHGPSEVAVPGGWYMHGLVTEAAASGRLGKDGYVTVTFDKLVSPDRQFEVPFDAHVTSKPTMAKAIAKNVLIGSGHVSLGAAGGAIMAVQFGGIGTAIATHGISVGVGAGIGATVGLIGAAKRKGSISAIVPGQAMKLVVAQPVSLPGFDAGLIPSAKPIAKLKDFEVLINKVGFLKDPSGDNDSKLLTVDVTVNNKTAHEYGFSNMAVVSDSGERYYPDVLLNGGGDFVKKKVKPDTSGNAVVAFSVDGKRHKYWLVLLDRINNQELNRVPIN